MPLRQATMAAAQPARFSTPRPSKCSTALSTCTAEIMLTNPLQDSCIYARH
jgi:hypothetical protein